mmetsp:Transcript_33561/g.75787  ORF Transcript_33561/g.75787 Transcript_33561/m.75787 type:complete len:227 (-) Transcript_33561:1237-1917(-)
MSPSSPPPEYEATVASATTTAPSQRPTRASGSPRNRNNLRARSQAYLQSTKKPSRDDSDTEARSETTVQRSNPASDASAMASCTYDTPPPGQNPIQHATDRLTAQLVYPPSPSLRVPGAPNLEGHDPPTANPDATAPTPGPDADQLAAAGLVAQRRLLEAATHQANQTGQLAAKYDHASNSATPRIRTAQMKRYIQARQSAPLPDLMLEMVRICGQSGEDPGAASP